MAVLAESMKRLRDQIVMLRRARAVFRAELMQSTRATQNQVAALRRAIASDLGGARRAWSGPGQEAHRAASSSPPAPVPAQGAEHQPAPPASRIGDERQGPHTARKARLKKRKQR